MSSKEKTINNLSIATLNKVARGRIQDADFAKETSKLTKLKFFNSLL